MGAAASELSAEEVQELVDATPFSHGDVRRLYARFMALDRAKSGWISSQDLALIPELSMNPLVDRIIALFDVSGKDQVDFHMFVHTLAVFHPSAPLEAKRRFVFRCYDVDGDGAVSQNDLYHVMKLLVGANLPDSRVETIVRKTFEAHGIAEGGKMDQHTFYGALDVEDALGLTVSFQK